MSRDSSCEAAGTFLCGRTVQKLGHRLLQEWSQDCYFCTEIVVYTNSYNSECNMRLYWWNNSVVSTLPTSSKYFLWHAAAQVPWPSLIATSAQATVSANSPVNSLAVVRGVTLKSTPSACWATGKQKPLELPLEDSTSMILLQWKKKSPSPLKICNSIFFFGEKCVQYVNKYCTFSVLPVPWSL